MRTNVRVLAVALAAVGVALSAAWMAPLNGDEKTNDLSREQVSMPAAPAASSGDKPGGDKPKRFADFGESVKDMTATEGFFTLYRFDQSDKERDTEKLLCKIPKNMLNEDFLFATSISRGGPLTGYMWSDWLCRWQVAGTHLKLITPDTRFVTHEDKPVSDVVKRTYDETYLAALPIIAFTQQGDVLVDIGPMLKSNIADVTFMGGSVKPELSRWSKVKVFPDNILIEADLALGSQMGGRSVGVAYSFQRLPKLGGFKPRVADQRIGYFGTTRQDWGKPAEARDTFDRYVNRWNLEKRDPSLELSPPKKPITFIIEKTVPIQWRRWVRAGIEDWNKAFEKIGFVDAIVVQQQTDDNEFKDYDPEDSRYNFFRWIVTGQGFAMGPSRADPRTGQILDADIIMDDSFVRAYMTSFDVFSVGGGGPTSLLGDGAELFEQLYPELIPPVLRPRQLDVVHPSVAATQQIIDTAHEKMQHHRQGVCNYASGLAQELALGQFAMIATGSGKKIPEHLLGVAIKEVVAHEVGHTLGLRHNFKASSWLSLDEIKRRRNETDEPYIGSVMDYNPLVFFADDDLSKIRNVMTPTIGPYDEWAIEYGYKVPTGNEADMLKEIAGRCTVAGLAYATDEDTLGAFSPDPAVNRFDLSDDPLAWSKTRVDLCDKLVSNVTDWAAQKGEPRYYITQAFNILWSQRARNFQYVTRVIGGQYFNRDQQGDPDARPAFQIVDGETQRKALASLRDTLFADAFFKTNADVLNMLAPQRWMDWSSPNSFSARVDYPIHDRILALQSIAVVNLLSPPVLQRIYDAELKTADAKKFTAAELLTTLKEQIWPQLKSATSGNYTDAQPMISSISRNLQKLYLNQMLQMAQQTPGSGMSPDLSGMVRFSLRELSDQIGTALKQAAPDGKPSRLDFASRGHLTECKSNIDRVLEAQYVVR